MNDSTDNAEAPADLTAFLADSLAHHDEHEAQRAAEADRQKKVIVGGIVKMLSTLDASKLQALLAFADSGFVTDQQVTDQQVTDQLTEARQTITGLRSEVDNLRQQNQNLGGAHTIAFTSSEEKETAEALFAQLRTGNGTLMDPDSLARIFESSRRQPSGQPVTTQLPQQPPPFPGSGQQRQRGGNGTSGRQQGRRSRQGSSGSQPGVVRRTVQRVTRPQPVQS